MANITAGRGACNAPFLQLSNFDSTVGCNEPIMKLAGHALLSGDQIFPVAFVLLYQQLKAPSIVVCLVP